MCQRDQSKAESQPSESDAELGAVCGETLVTTDCWGPWGCTHRCRTSLGRACRTLAHCTPPPDGSARPDTKRSCPRGNGSRTSGGRPRWRARAARRCRPRQQRRGVYKRPATPGHLGVEEVPGGKVRGGWAHLGVRGGGCEEHEGADEERVLERAAGAVAVEGDGAARRRVAGAAPGGCRVGREGLLAATADRQTRDEA